MKRQYLILVATLVMTYPLMASGVGMPVTGPTMGFPEGTPKETVSNVLEYLRDQVTFVDGSFINEFTGQRYVGSAQKLGGLIELLHNHGFEVRVTFVDLKDDRVAFTLAQNAHEMGKVSIGINTTKKGFDLSGLSIRIAPGKSEADKETRVKSN